MSLMKHLAFDALDAVTGERGHAMSHDTPITPDEMSQHALGPVVCNWHCGGNPTTEGYHARDCPLYRVQRAGSDLLTALEAVLAEPNDRNWAAAREAVRKARGKS